MAKYFRGIAQGSAFALLLWFLLTRRTHPHQYMLNLLMQLGQIV
jgi:hypothetical protein